MDVGCKAEPWKPCVLVFLFYASFFRIYSSIFNMKYIIVNIWHGIRANALTFSCILQSCLCWYSPLSQLLRSVSFLRPLPTAPLLSEVPKAKSLPPKALSLLLKDHCLLGSVNCDLRLWHQRYHYVDPKLIYSTSPKSSPSDQPRAGQSFNEDYPCAFSVAPILMPLQPSKSSSSERPRRQGIGINGRSTCPHAPLEDQCV